MYLHHKSHLSDSNIENYKVVKHLIQQIRKISKT